MKILIYLEIKKQLKLIYANKVLEIENDNSFVWVSKFKALEKLNRLNDLILAYDEAFKVFPNDEELIKDKKIRISRMNVN